MNSKKSFDQVHVDVSVSMYQCIVFCRVFTFAFCAEERLGVGWDTHDVLQTSNEPTKNENNEITF